MGWQRSDEHSLKPRHDPCKLLKLSPLSVSCVLTYFVPDHLHILPSFSTCIAILSSPCKKGDYIFHGGIFLKTKRRHFSLWDFQPVTAILHFFLYLYVVLLCILRFKLFHQLYNRLHSVSSEQILFARLMFEVDLEYFWPAFLRK